MLFMRKGRRRRRKKIEGDKGDCVLLKEVVLTDESARSDRKKKENPNSDELKLAGKWNTCSI